MLYLTSSQPIADADPVDFKTKLGKTNNHEVITNFKSTASAGKLVTLPQQGH